MKKVTSILMAFVLMLTLIPTAWAEGTATALPNAENGVYTLQEDTTISKWTIGKNENWVIDLNGKKLEYTGVKSVTVSDGSTLTIKNGTLVANGVGTSALKGTGAFLTIQKGCSVELDTVVLKTNGSALYPQGDTARVTVNGSKIYCGVYAVATNAATVDNYNVVIELKDSTFTTDTGYENGDGDSCPVLINVPGKLTMDNCTVNGTRQGVLVRSGNATITNCTINLKSTQGLDGITGSPLFADNGKYENKNWSSGDEVPMGALVVGNRSNAYQYPATCALTDTKVNGRVYTYGNTAEGKGATLTMGGSCAVVGDIVKGNEAVAISITGGTFNTNPTAYLAAGYTASENNGTFTVVPKDYVAQIGETKYESLADAVAVGGDIKLLKDVTLTSGLAINKDITLDLNGKTLERKNGYIFDVYSNMTVKNGTVKFSEKPAESGAAIWVNKTAKLTVESNVTVEAPDNCFDIAYDKSCTAAEVILRGKLVGGSGVTMNGNIGEGTSNKLTVDGATIDVTGHGIYQAGCADTNFTINNSVITGGCTGIEVRAGKLTVTNSTITGNGEFAVKPNGSGTTTDGAGIAIAQHTTKQPIDVTIAGGTVTGEYAVYESNPQKNSAEDIAKVKVAVTGGTFTGKIYSEDVANFITGGTFSTNPKDYVPSEGYTVAKKDSVYTVSAKVKNEDGTGETTSAVKLEVSSTSDAAINTTVNKNDIETNKELTVTNNKTAVTINQTGVAAIVGTGAALNLSIKADSKTPESANTAAYNKAMAGKDANSAVVVNISLTNGASNVFATDVPGAYALVTVPYTTDKADKLTVYYLNGSDATALTKVADAAAPGAALNTFSYDAANKLITLKLPHFSEYLISTTATRSVVHHYGGTGTTTTTGTKTNSPTTFDAGVGIYAVSAILSVTGMAWVGTKQRKH